MCAQSGSLLGTHRLRGLPSFLRQHLLDVSPHAAGPRESRPRVPPGRAGSVPAVTDASTYSRKTTEPQAKPPPKAVMRMVVPGPTRPSARASARQMGIEAEEVFP